MLRALVLLRWCAGVRSRCAGVLTACGSTAGRSKRLALAQMLTSYARAIKPLPAAGASLSADLVAAPLTEEQRRFVIDKVKNALCKLVSNTSTEESIVKQEMLAHVQTYDCMNLLDPSFGAAFEKFLFHKPKAMFKAAIAAHHAANADAETLGEVQLA